MTSHTARIDPDFFQKIVQIIPNPVFIKNSRFKYIHVNDAFCKSFGIEKDEILGKSDDLFFPLSECEIFRKIDQRILSDGIPVENEESATLRDGRNITVITRKSLLETNGEQFILGTVTDITERTVMLKKLQDSEIKLKSLIDLLPNLLLIHRNGKVQFANKAFMKTLGYNGDELTGMNISQLFKDPKATGKNFSLVKKFTSTDDRFNEIEIKTSAGNQPVNTYLLLNSEIDYEGGAAVMTILTDITERKNLEKYVLSKIIETEEKERRRIAADIHDELGPLISSARLQLGFLERSQGTAGFVESSERVYKILEYMDRKMHFIVQDIVPHEIDLNGLGAAVMDLCKTTEQNKELVIDVKSNLDNSRFPKEVELHFYRIISELINNSMKHSGATRIFLKMNRSKTMFRVWYSDNGKGYDIDKVLEKNSGLGINNIFYRASLINSDLNFEKKDGKVIVRISKKLE